MTPSAGAAKSDFPFLDFDELTAHTKAQKQDDLVRMLHSAQSEDYVTWNVFRGLLRREDWWPHLLQIALMAGASALPRVDEPPAVELWRRVASPPEYERASRKRMITSGLPEWQARAGNPKPVEGTSEIDLSLEGSTYLIFIEAKVGADISPRTTYDPARDQITRNMDCLIEEAGPKTPYLWMVVRDRDPGRAYMQLLDRYATHPDELAEFLPHRNPELVAAIARRGVVLAWKDLISLLPKTEEMAPVRAELEHRFFPGHEAKL